MFSGHIYAECPTEIQERKIKWSNREAPAAARLAVRWPEAAVSDGRKRLPKLRFLLRSCLAGRQPTTGTKCNWHLKKCQNPDCGDQIGKTACLKSKDLK